MIKTVAIVGTVVAGLAFAAGWYAGWKSTMKIVDDVMARRPKQG